MKILVVLPILIPLITAAVLLILSPYQKLCRWLGIAGPLALLIAAICLCRVVMQEGILTVQMGSWPAPYGITFVADFLSAVMVLITGIMGFVVAVYSLVNIDQKQESFFYYSLYQILLLGVCGCFLTGDIFNLYVWFEVMLVASFVLMASGAGKAQLIGSVKYVALSLISSGIFLSACGIIYGYVGSLNMADLAIKLKYADPLILSILFTMFLVAFGLKAAIFPLFFWLPDSYHTPPVAISAIFAGLLTKVGVYAMFRLFTLFFIPQVAFAQPMLVIAGLTMVTGVLGAVAHQEMRRILSFHIISQIGYMILGLGLLTPLAVAGSIFYIVHHIIVKTNLFLISGVVTRLKGSAELSRVGGVYQSSPLLGLLFLIPALSLAGLPPLSGFFSKLFLVKSSLSLAEYWIVGVALVVGLLTLLSMLKIWAEVFWKEMPATKKGKKIKALTMERIDTHLPHAIIPQNP